MTVSMTDEQLEREIRSALASQAEDVEAAPTATEMVVRIRSAALRGASLRQRSWWPRALPADRRFVVATVALLLLALVGSLVVVGKMLELEAPIVVNPNESTSQPSSTPRVEPTRQIQPPTVESGFAETALGQLSWTKLRGTGDTLPLGDIFETPRGFAALEDDPGGSGSRFWESPDGLAWTVRPLPVPAIGAVGHGFADGEHWIWSRSEFRLWRSSDFESWVEVELRDLAPAPVAGLRWSMDSMGPTTVGSTTLLPWSVGGRLELSELLGIPLEPGDRLGLKDDWKAFGEVRPVFLTRAGVSSHVASIRVELEGTIVRVIDAQRGVVAAEIDAAATGIAADRLAERLSMYAITPELRGGAMISDGVAQPMMYPMPADAPLADDHFEDLVAIDGEFVGWTMPSGLVGGSSLIWSSPDGREWTAQGEVSIPVSDAASHGFTLLRRGDGDPGEGLIASAIVNEGDQQRVEIWSSADGRIWARDGLVYTYPEISLYPFRAPSASGGYLATADDYQLWVSTTGEEWAVVEGVPGVGASLDEGESGGSMMLQVTRDAVFYIEDNYATRTVWVFRILS